MFRATQSLDSRYEGFTFDDFIRMVKTLSAWNVQGRADTISNDDRVRNMIDGGYKSTKTHIDQIRNEIEVHRLELMSQR